MINRQNYFLIKQYLEYLLKTKKLSPKSVERYWFYLRYLLLWAWDIVFSQAHLIKPSFGDYVESIRIEKKGVGKVPLTKETQKKIILNAKCFFEWAKEYREDEFRQLPGYWRRDLIPPRVRPSSKDHNYITYDEIISIAAMEIPETDLVLRRIQASCCFLYLTGQRNLAHVTTPMAAVNLANLELHQDPEKYGVQTKGGKCEVTTFMPIPELLQKVTEWDTFLRKNVPENLWMTFPWYAPFENHWGEITLSFHPTGANRNQALGDDVFLMHQKAKIDTSKTSHDYRHGHVQYGLEHSRTVPQYHAVSRNVMHSSIAVTDQIYATLDINERKTLLSQMTPDNLMAKDDEFYNYMKNRSRESIADAISKLAKLMVP